MSWILDDISRKLVTAFTVVGPSRHQLASIGRFHFVVDSMPCVVAGELVYLVMQLEGDTSLTGRNGSCAKPPAVRGAPSFGPSGSCWANDVGGI